MAGLRRVSTKNDVVTTFVQGLCLALVVAVTGACPAKVDDIQSPSSSLVAIYDAARRGDEPAFKAGLSKNFVLAIERYQEIGETSRPELKGAFDWPVFMRSMSQTRPEPKQENVRGNKATVIAADASGNPAGTEMVMEDGRWKLEVPGSMIRGLDHLDEVVAVAKGEEVLPTPDLPRGGGGKADRMKSLPADATEAQRNKAKALDAFDLGDLTGSVRLLETALEQNPGDTELVVGLGRAYVQTSEGAKAVALFEKHLKTDGKAPAVRHYLGMAYMFDKRYADAATQWRKVLEVDPAYGAEFRLESRAQIAEQMAKAPEAAEAAAGSMPSGH